MEEISQYPSFKRIECAVRNLKRNGFKEITPQDIPNVKIFVTDDNNRKSPEDFISYLVTKGRYEIYTYRLTKPNYSDIIKRWEEERLIMLGRKITNA